jgi:hypothetical protein
MQKSGCANGVTNIETAQGTMRELLPEFANESTVSALPLFDPAL